jgi:hypothetical protein
MTTRDQVLVILLWICVLAQSTWVGLIWEEISEPPAVTEWPR